MKLFDKNYDRDDQPDFANINLLGKCNVDCYFCLGKDIVDNCGKSLIDNRHDLKIHFSAWKNWDKFLQALEKQKIKKVYITGQNTDALLYRHLSALVDYLQNLGYGVGLRTNGLLWHHHIDTINKCKMSTGYSIHSLDPDANKKIMGIQFVPYWDAALKATERPRVSMVLNRWNSHELFDIVDLVKRHPNVRYMQVRRVSTDTRKKLLELDLRIYELIYNEISQQYPHVRDFHGAPIHNIDGVECCFWRTVQTNINSINYFTDGTLSDRYFVVEGYMKENNIRMQ